MRAILIYVMSSRYFRLVDKYHRWQPLYRENESPLYELGERIDSLKIKIQVFLPEFPFHKTY